MASVKRNNVYLVGNYEKDIKDSKLPSKKHLLCFFLHNHNKLVRLFEILQLKLLKGG